MRKLLLGLVAVAAVVATLRWWLVREPAIEPIEAARHAPGDEMATPRPVEAAAPVALRRDESAVERGSEADAKPLPPDARGETVVVAPPAKPALLVHVRDATTHAPLRDVTVIHCWKVVIGDHAHSAVPAADRRVAHSEETLARGGASPIAIEASEKVTRLQRATTLCVGASGYAWSSRKVDFELGGDVTFDLMPGGSIEVAIAGDVSLARPGDDPSESIGEAPLIRVRRKPDAAPEPEPFDLEGALAEAKERIASATEGELAMWFADGVTPDDAALRAMLLEEHEQELRDAETLETEWPVADMAPSLDGPTRIEGLLPGGYAVSLERGSDWNKALVFARAEVLVVAGSTARVTLVAAPVVRPQPGPFSGRLRLSPAWGADRIDLRFEPLDVPGSSGGDEFRLRLQELAASRSEWHPFDAGPRLTGRWLVRAHDYAFAQIVDTGPAGRADLEIVIGDPCDVAIRLIDAATGAPIVSAGRHAIAWSCVFPETEDWSGRGKANWSTVEVCYRCRAPAGEIMVWLDSELTRLYDGVARQRLRVVPGRNEVRFVLRRLQALELRFEVDGRPPADFLERFGAAEIELVSIATGKRRRDYDDIDLDQTLCYRLPDPGRWRVEVPRIPGYRLIEPFEVDIAAQQLTVQVVALVRDDG